MSGRIQVVRAGHNGEKASDVGTKVCLKYTRFNYRARQTRRRRAAEMTREICSESEVSDAVKHQCFSRYSGGKDIR